MHFVFCLFVCILWVGRLRTAQQWTGTVCDNSRIIKFLKKLKQFSVEFAMEFLFSVEEKKSSETLNIKWTLARTYKNRTLTYNLCSNQYREPNYPLQQLAQSSLNVYNAHKLSYCLSSLPTQNLSRESQICSPNQSYKMPCF